MFGQHDKKLSNGGVSNASRKVIKEARLRRGTRRGGARRGGAPWLVTDRKQEPSKCRRGASNPQEANPCPSRQRIACTEALKLEPNQYLGLFLGLQAVTNPCCPGIDGKLQGGSGEVRTERSARAGAKSCSRAPPPTQSEQASFFMAPA